MYGPRAKGEVERAEEEGAAHVDDQEEGEHDHRRPIRETVHRLKQPLVRVNWRAREKGEAGRDAGGQLRLGSSVAPALAHRQSDGRSSLCTTSFWWLVVSVSAWVIVENVDIRRSAAMCRELERCIDGELDGEEPVGEVIPATFRTCASSVEKLHIRGFSFRWQC